MASTIHPFEAAGLGRAPFKCTGMETRKYQACPGAPIQPGGCCDYCGTGIYDCYAIKSADGRRFIVGCDCVAKVVKACARTDFEREAAAMTNAINKIKTDAKHARDDAKIAEAKALLAANADALNGVWYSPSPMKHARTVAEQIEWMLHNGGRALKVRGAKLLALHINQGAR